MTTERLSVEEIAPRPPKMTIVAPQTPEPAAYPPEPIPPPAAPAPPPRDDVALLRELYRLMGAALSARALLAVAFLGAFILTGAVVFRQSWPALIALCVYCAATVGPVTLIELSRKS